ncbi:hypothetical protein ASF30_12425 [Leifsonia sp. Leaf264]|nr:hypothetical protein ASF30_12425 [Leifsonia sp. Leaf264]
MEAAVPADHTTMTDNTLTHLWVDLEATGLDPVLDDIIEFGVIGTNNNLDTLFEYEAVVFASEAAVNRAAANDPVREMHTGNGLMAIISDPILRQELPTVELVERQIIDLIKSYPHNGTLVLSGSGVWQYDTKMLLHKTPALRSLLDDRETNDVGLVRKAYRRATGTDLTGVNDGKNHRAIVDIRLHLAEARIQADMYRAHAQRVAHQEVAV